MERFFIEFDNTDEVVMAGETITGRVFFELKEPIKADALSVNLKGKSATFWNETTSTSSSTNLGTATASSSIRTINHANEYGNKKLHVSITKTLWERNDTQDGIDAGRFSFAFAFFIPDTCPPSYEGAMGHVRYHCEARVKRSWFRLDCSAKKTFTVCTAVPLTDVTDVDQPMFVQNRRHIAGICCCMHRGAVTVQTNLLRRGYVPGECIRVGIDVDNRSSRNVNRIQMRLIESADFIGKCGGGGGEIQRSQQQHRLILERKRVDRIVCARTENMTAERGTSKIVCHELLIPPIAPTFEDVGILKVEYFVEVKVIVDSLLFEKSVKLRLPITIGTVPLLQNGPLDNTDPSAKPAYKRSQFAGVNVEEKNEKNAPVLFVPKYRYYYHEENTMRQSKKKKPLHKKVSRISTGTDSSAVLISPVQVTATLHEEKKEHDH